MWDGQDRTGYWSRGIARAVYTLVWMSSIALESGVCDQ